MEYTLHKTHGGAHHLKLGRSLVAKIEPVQLAPTKAPGILGAFKAPVEQNRYKITHLAGVPDEHFMTVHAAASYAMHYHNRGKHNNVEHPVTNIGNHIIALKKAIFDAASDHRMEDEGSQQALLDLSMHHAQLHKKYKKHFEGE